MKNYTRHLECGCKIVVIGKSDNAEIHYCPLHKSAPTIHEALKSVLDDANNGSFTTLAGSVRKLVEQALAQAKPN